MVVFYALREGYSPEQVKRTMSVRELKEYLDNFNDDDKIYIANDGGYTYGGIREGIFNEK